MRDVNDLQKNLLPEYIKLIEIDWKHQIIS